MAFSFKQFSVTDDRSTMKVGTDAVLLGAWANVDNIDSILDIGTGCGVIALMLAQRSEVFVEAIDVDSDSINQAEVNFNNSPWKNRLKLYINTVQKHARFVNTHYSLIVCNPPYFSDHLRSENEKRNLARHADKLSFEDLAFSVSLLLTEEGRFCVILPVEESDKFRQIALNNDLYCVKRTYIYSKPDVDPIRVLSQFQFTKLPIETSSIVLRNNDDSYTDAYKNLTKDFYLNF